MKQCLHTFEELNQNINSDKSKLASIKNKEVEALNQATRENILNAIEDCKSSLEQTSKKATNFVQQAQVCVLILSVLDFNFNSY